MRNRLRALLTCFAILVLAASCSRKQESTDTAIPPPDTARAVVAVAELRPTEGSTVHGTVTFTQEPGGMRMVAHLSGLAPGDHGFHVHEVGDCSAPDGSSAGDHFNPGGMSHGGPDAEMHHAGDFGNLTADAQGNADSDRLFPNLTLEGAESIVGRSLVVHANTDDLNTQPSGNSGARLACGVIALQ